MDKDKIVDLDVGPDAINCRKCKRAHLKSFNCEER